MDEKEEKQESENQNFSEQKHLAAMSVIEELKSKNEKLEAYNKRLHEQANHMLDELEKCHRMLIDKQEVIEKNNEEGAREKIELTYQLREMETNVKMFMDEKNIIQDKYDALKAEYKSLRLGVDNLKTDITKTSSVNECECEATLSSSEDSEETDDEKDAQPLLPPDVQRKIINKLEKEIRALRRENACLANVVEHPEFKFENQDELNQLKLEKATVERMMMNEQLQRLQCQRNLDSACRIIEKMKPQENEIIELKKRIKSLEWQVIGMEFERDTLLKDIARALTLLRKIVNTTKSWYANDAQDENVRLLGEEFFTGIGEIELYLKYVKQYDKISEEKKDKNEPLNESDVDKQMTQSRPPDHGRKVYCNLKSEYDYLYARYQELIECHNDLKTNYNRIKFNLQQSSSDANKSQENSIHTRMESAQNSSVDENLSDK